MTLWMVRAGEQGYLAGEFEQKRCVAVGFDGVGDFAPLSTLEMVKARLSVVYPSMSPVRLSIAAGVVWKFRSVMSKGDFIVTYDPSRRTYLVGTVTGDYQYRPGYVSDYAHVRDVSWDRAVLRDDLSPASRNSLGALVTIFEPGEAVLADLLADRTTVRSRPAEERAEEQIERMSELDQIRLEQVNRAHEFIKDRINRLDPGQVEQLVAAILRAIGYRARVTPVGPDRGRDVVASPDGLGLQAPRIVGEVKHRRAAMGAPEIRAFVGGLRAEDRGLYVSTGGFTREARYEADRSAVPITLVDLDELTNLVVEHYEGFDAVGRGLVPLQRFYWPVG